MPKTEPFERYFDRYESWFIKNYFAYQAEVAAIKAHLSAGGRGLEIGIGSGLFARLLGINYGIDPSATMRQQAIKRGVKYVIGAVAEYLPFKKDYFDFALMVTTICFLDNVHRAFGEAWHVVKPGGKLIIGFVDKNSPIGELYKKYKNENVFYRHAVFYSTEQVTSFLERSNFYGFEYTQTIFRMLDKITKSEKVKEGYGEGSFVVVSGLKRE